MVGGFKSESVRVSGSARAFAQPPRSPRLNPDDSCGPTKKPPRGVPAVCPAPTVANPAVAYLHRLLLSSAAAVSATMGTVTGAAGLI